MYKRQGLIYSENIATDSNQMDGFTIIMMSMMKFTANQIILILAGLVMVEMLRWTAMRFVLQVHQLEKYR